MDAYMNYAILGLEAALCAIIVWLFYGERKARMNQASTGMCADKVRHMLLWVGEHGLDPYELDAMFGTHFKKELKSIPRVCCGRLPGSDRRVQDSDIDGPPWSFTPLNAYFSPYDFVRYMCLQHVPLNVIEQVAAVFQGPMLQEGWVQALHHGFTGEIASAHTAHKKNIALKIALAPIESTGRPLPMKATISEKVCELTAQTDNAPTKTRPAKTILSPIEEALDEDISDVTQSKSTNVPTFQTLSESRGSTPDSEDSNATLVDGLPLEELDNKLRQAIFTDRAMVAEPEAISSSTALKSALKQPPKPRPRPIFKRRSNSRSPERTVSWEATTLTAVESPAESENSSLLEDEVYNAYELPLKPAHDFEMPVKTWRRSVKKGNTLGAFVKAASKSFDKRAPTRNLTTQESKSPLRVRSDSDTKLRIPVDRAEGASGAMKGLETK